MQDSLRANRNEIKGFMTMSFEQLAICPVLINLLTRYPILKHMLVMTSSNVKDARCRPATWMLFPMSSRKSRKLNGRT